MIELEGIEKKYDLGAVQVAALEDVNGQGVTIVMVTHNDELGARAKRVVHIQDGHIQDGYSPDGNPAVAYGLIGEFTGQSAEERRRA